MELGRNQQNAFDRSAFTQANVEISSLKSRLPQEAVRTLAEEVMRRLAERAARLPVAQEPDSGMIDRLCTALVSEDLDAGARMIARIRQDGIPVETIYLSYLAQAARRLGEWWDEDRVSFTEVTVAASRIYAILRGMRDVLTPGPSTQAQHAVFASVPDEIHTLGVTMAADLFRKQGWQIELLVGLPHEALVTALQESEAPVIGLSASGAKSLVSLARLILAIRINAPSALVLISGQIVTDEEDRVRFLGADAIAHDVPEAKREMQRLADLAAARQTVPPPPMPPIGA